MKIISLYAIPCMVILIVGYGFAKKTDVYSAFTDGAASGLKSVVAIIPSVLGLFAAIGVFRASGAMELLGAAMRPVTDFFDIPDSLVSFGLLRPVSGSGSLAMANDIFVNEGADSFVSRVISVMMGSTETTFYTLAVYFGAVGIKNTSYAMKCALLADFVCFISSILVCRIMFL